MCRLRRQMAQMNAAYCIHPSPMMYFGSSNTGKPCYYEHHITIQITKLFRNPPLTSYQIKSDLFFHKEMKGGLNKK